MIDLAQFVFAEDTIVDCLATTLFDLFFDNFRSKDDTTAVATDKQSTD